MAPPSFEGYDFVSEVLLTVLLGAMALYIGYRNLTASGKKPVQVSQLLIYPIKSCAEISLAQAKATPLGFEKDRVFQISEATTAEAQYCTPRDKKYAKLFHVKPTFKDDDEETLVLTAPNAKEPLEISLQLDKSKVSQKKATPMIGPKVTLDDYGPKVASWFEMVVGLPKNSICLTGIGKDFRRIVKVNSDQNEDLPPSSETSDDATYPVSLADEAPYLLTSTSSLDDLNKRLVARGKDPVDMRRFRPNIVIDGGTSSLEPWMEDSWSRIRIGGTAEFHVWQRCGRCTMTTIDRDSLARGPEPLATLSTFRERDAAQRNFGMHLIPVASTCPATLKVGDTIEVLEYNADRQAEWKKLFG